MANFYAMLLSQISAWLLLLLFILRGRISRWHFLEPAKTLVEYCGLAVDVVLQVVTGPFLLPIFKASLLPLSDLDDIAIGSAWFWLAFVDGAIICSVALRLASVDFNSSWISTTGWGVANPSRDMVPTKIDRLGKRRHPLAAANPRHDKIEVISKMLLAFNLVVVSGQSPHCRSCLAVAAIVRVAIGFLILFNSVANPRFFSTHGFVNFNAAQTSAAAGLLVSYVASAAAVWAETHNQLDASWLLLLNGASLPVAVIAFYLHESLARCLVGSRVRGETLGSEQIALLA